MAVVAVGERGRSADLPERDARLLERRWCPNSLLECPAFVESSTAARMYTMLGIDSKRSLNLLPPREPIGSWNPTLARVAAGWVLQASRRWGWSLLLLGRKVSDAFRCPRDLDWLDEVVVSGVRCMLVPHPSGRSLLMNSVEFREMVRQSTQRFRNEDFARRQATNWGYLDGR